MHPNTEADAVSQSKSFTVRVSPSPAVVTLSFALNVDQSVPVSRPVTPALALLKREDVAILVASAVDPVIFPRTLFAETCARFAKGRSPVTPVEREIGR